MVKSIRLPRREVLWVCIIGAAIATITFALLAPSTINDFLGPGTQPNTLT